MKLPNLVENLLMDPTVTDVCINGSKGLFWDCGEGLVSSAEIGKNSLLNEEEIKTWIIHELAQVGKTWDARYPFVDATLKSGHRVHVVFPPLSPTGILVSLRRLPSSESGIRSLRWAKSEHYDLAKKIIQKGDSAIICGSTGSGKTTLANDLLGEIPHSERIIALEDTPELAPCHPHFLSLISRPPNADGYGEVTLRTLLRQTLRMRPDRIILGECRGTEVLELLQALNTGHRGALATLHANSPRDGLRRIELLCLLASQGALPLQGIRELLAVGIQWVIQVRKTENTRRISEIWRIEGREGDTILMRPVI